MRFISLASVAWVATPVAVAFMMPQHARSNAKNIVASRSHALYMADKKSRRELNIEQLQLEIDKSLAEREELRQQLEQDIREFQDQYLREKKRIENVDASIVDKTKRLQNIQAGGGGLLESLEGIGDLETLAPVAAAPVALAAVVAGRTVLVRRREKARQQEIARARERQRLLEEAQEKERLEAEAKKKQLTRSRFLKAVPVVSGILGLGYLASTFTGGIDIDSIPFGTSTPQEKVVLPETPMPETTLLGSEKTAPTDESTAFPDIGIDTQEKEEESLDVLDKPDGDSDEKIEISGTVSKALENVKIPTDTSGVQDAVSGALSSMKELQMPDVGDSIVDTLEEVPTPVLIAVGASATLAAIASAVFSLTKDDSDSTKSKPKRASPQSLDKTAFDARPTTESTKAPKSSAPKVKTSLGVPPPAASPPKSSTTAKDGATASNRKLPSLSAKKLEPPKVDTDEPEPSKATPKTEVVKSSPSAASGKQQESGKSQSKTGPSDAKVTNPDAPTHDPSESTGSGAATTPTAAKADINKIKSTTASPAVASRQKGSTEPAAPEKEKAGAVDKSKSSTDARPNTSPKKPETAVPVKRTAETETTATQASNTDRTTQSKEVKDDGKLKGINASYLDSLSKTERELGGKTSPQEAGVATSPPTKRAEATLNGASLKDSIIKEVTSTNTQLEPAKASEAKTKDVDATNPSQATEKEASISSKHPPSRSSRLAPQKEPEAKTTTPKSVGKQSSKSSPKNVPGQKEEATLSKAVSSTKADYDKEGKATEKSMVSPTSVSTAKEMTKPDIPKATNTVAAEAMKPPASRSDPTTQPQNKEYETTTVPQESDDERETSSETARMSSRIPPSQRASPKGFGSSATLSKTDAGAKEGKSKTKAADEKYPSASRRDTLSTASTEVLKKSSIAVESRSNEIEKTPSSTTSSAPPPSLKSKATKPDLRTSEVTSEEKAVTSAKKLDAEQTTASETARISSRIPPSQLTSPQGFGSSASSSKTEAKAKEGSSQTKVADVRSTSALGKDTKSINEAVAKSGVVGESQSKVNQLPPSSTIGVPSATFEAKTTKPDIGKLTSEEEATTSTQQSDAEQTTASETARISSRIPPSQLTSPRGFGSPTSSSKTEFKVKEASTQTTVADGKSPSASGKDTKSNEAVAKSGVVGESQSKVNQSPSSSTIGVPSATSDVRKVTSEEEATTSTQQSDAEQTAPSETARISSRIPPSQLTSPRGFGSPTSSSKTKSKMKSASTQTPVADGSSPSPSGKDTKSNEAVAKSGVAGESPSKTDQSPSSTMLGVPPAASKSKKTKPDLRKVTSKEEAATSTKNSDNEQAISSETARVSSRIPLSQRTSPQGFGQRAPFSEPGAKAIEERSQRKSADERSSSASRKPILTTSSKQGATRSGVAAKSQSKVDTSSPSTTLGVPRLTSKAKKKPTKPDFPTASSAGIDDTLKAPASQSAASTPEKEQDAKPAAQKLGDDSTTPSVTARMSSRIPPSQRAPSQGFGTPAPSSKTNIKWKVEIAETKLVDEKSPPPSDKDAVKESQSKVKESTLSQTLDSPPPGSTSTKGTVQPSIAKGTVSPEAVETSNDSASRSSPPTPQKDTMKSVGDPTQPSQTARPSSRIPPSRRTAPQGFGKPVSSFKIKDKAVPMNKAARELSNSPISNIEGTDLPASKNREAGTTDEGKDSAKADIAQGGNSSDASTRPVTEKPDNSQIPPYMRPDFGKRRPPLKKDRLGNREDVRANDDENTSTDSGPTDDSSKRFGF